MLATRFVFASAVVLGDVSCATMVTAQDQPIDTARSVLKVRVFNSGSFSAFAHNHEIAGPIADGTVHLQATMEGPDVLDIKKFSEISFQSTAIQKKGRQTLGDSRKSHPPWAYFACPS